MGNSPQLRPVLCGTANPCKVGRGQRGPLGFLRCGQVEELAILDAERLIGSLLLPFSRLDPSR